MLHLFVFWKERKDKHFFANKGEIAFFCFFSFDVLVAYALLFLQKVLHLFVEFRYQYVANNKLDKTSKESINQFKNALTNVLDFLMESGFVLKTTDEEVNFKKECPICGHPIRNKLDSKVYHFICPACNSHFVINNDIHFIMSAVRKNREKRYKDEKTILNSPTLIKEMESQKQENASLKIQLDRIKSKWWYKLLNHF